MEKTNTEECVRGSFFIVVCIENASFAICIFQIMIHGCYFSNYDIWCDFLWVSKLVVYYDFILTYVTVVTIILIII